MSLFLSLECSLNQGSLALTELNKKNLKELGFKKWTHQAFKSAHSDKLPLEIDQILKKAGKKLSDLQFLAVGTGPGRWTGVRVAISTIRALSFALNIPVYPVNSLRICAEAFLTSCQPVFTALNGFKQLVYFAEFHSLEDKKGKVCLLPLQDYFKKMELKTLGDKKPVCLSDLEDFYPLPDSLKKNFRIKKPSPSARDLAQIIFKQKGVGQNWQELKAFYLRSPFK